MDQGTNQSKSWGENSTRVKIYHKTLFQGWSEWLKILQYMLFILEWLDLKSLKRWGQKYNFVPN